jgi:hypothetical protein
MLARTLRAHANGAAAASIRLLAYGSQSSPPANKRMEPSSVQSTSVLPAGGSSAAPLGGVDGLWTMRSMKEIEREVPNGTEAL